MIGKILVLLLGCSIFFSSPANNAAEKSRGHVIELPARPQDALSGSAFMKSIRRMTPARRESAIVREILRGNVPRFQRKLIPIEQRISSGRFKGQTVRYWAMPDYLALGSEQDFVWVPLNLHSAKTLADQLDLSLPTPKMVDAIYASASVKLKPEPIAFKRKITSSAYILQHNRLIQAQLKRYKWRAGELLAGHKKDVVQSRRLSTRPKAIAIYGWHSKADAPIQPLSTVHSADYADYSHGIRLVSNSVQVGSRTYDMRSILGRRETASILSHEGVIAQSPALRGGTLYPVAITD